MIQQIIIKNFKSIKELKFNAKRINLFIGKPNTGKSNLLEALGIFSLPYSDGGKLKFITRIESAVDLFFDNQTSQRIEVKADELSWQGWSEGDNVIIKCEIPGDSLPRFHYSLNPRGEIFYRSTQSPLPDIKFYRFRILEHFPKKEFSFLLPPDGENLLEILKTNTNIYDLVDEFLSEYKLKIVPEEKEYKLKILKIDTPRPILFPYFSLSDTFQRIIFYLTAIESNKNSVLLFEEPEAHAFPYYTKILAEIIALDNSNNQYFITTHNPYFLISILEKAPKNDVAIFITYLEDYQTKLKGLDDLEKEKILKEGKDVFFNIDQIIQK
jgi:predicted ATP-dependent endonuclease of OLD family